MDVIELDESNETCLSSEKINRLLKSNNNKYVVIENESAKPSLSWWKIFGFPARVDENNKSERIPGYVSCFRCFQTFIYSNKSGTTRLKEHENKCPRRLCSSSDSISVYSEEIDQSNDPSTAQSTLVQHGFKKSLKLSDKDIANMKTLCGE